MEEISPSNFWSQFVMKYCAAACSMMANRADKFEPVSGGSEMDHTEEAVGQLIVSGSDGAVNLELSEHALDAVALLV